MSAVRALKLTGGSALKLILQQQMESEFLQFLRVGGKKGEEEGEGHMLDPGKGG